MRAASCSLMLQLSFLSAVVYSSSLKVLSTPNLSRFTANWSQWEPVSSRDSSPESGTSLGSGIQGVRSRSRVPPLPLPMASSVRRSSPPDTSCALKLTSSARSCPMSAKLSTRNLRGFSARLFLSIFLMSSRACFSAMDSPLASLLAVWNTPSYALPSNICTSTLCPMSRVKMYTLCSFSALGCCGTAAMLALPLLTASPALYQA
mmetsp:Transcript_2791/g.7272  ORF Transcript_2791/g.7272 Transcript_2791/m.7272 type:complete len:205 (-) Transcript_2791:41-655(-)